MVYRGLVRGLNNPNISQRALYKRSPRLGHIWIESARVSRRICHRYFVRSFVYLSCERGPSPNFVTRASRSRVSRWTNVDVINCAPQTTTASSRDTPIGFLSPWSIFRNPGTHKTATKLKLNARSRTGERERERGMKNLEVFSILLLLHNSDPSSADSRATTRSPSRSARWYYFSYYVARSSKDFSNYPWIRAMALFQAINRMRSTYMWARELKIDSFFFQAVTVFFRRCDLYPWALMFILAGELR